MIPIMVAAQHLAQPRRATCGSDQGQSPSASGQLRSLTGFATGMMKSYVNNAVQNIVSHIQGAPA